MDVTATVTRELGLEGRYWWVATVETGGATQARRLDQLKAMVAELVALREDLPPGAEADINVTLDLSGVPELADALAAARAAEADARRAAERATQARHAVARATQGLPVRDLAVALGVSTQTAARLRHDAEVA
jgi:hypothetical protein